MTLEPYPQDHGLSIGWTELGEGAPTLIAFAQLAADAMRRPPAEEKLSPEARAILYAAKNRGVIEVKSVNTAFEAPSRFLAVYIELDEERTLVFRNRLQPEITVRFLDGFKQLCQAGLVMHHLYREFSLSSSGFQRAGLIQEEEVADQLSQGQEFGLHD